MFKVHVSLLYILPAHANFRGKIKKYLRLLDNHDRLKIRGNTNEQSGTLLPNRQIA